MKSITYTFAAVLFAALLAGCGSVISKNVLTGVNRDITVNQVRHDPERFVNVTVLWGGVILGTKNLENTTEIEVLETRLGYNDTPEFERSSSRGRFIIEAESYLDENVFKEGLGITVAGKVASVSTRKIGQMGYQYPVIRPIEMELSEEPPKEYYQPWPPSYYWDPYAPFYPYNPYFPYYPYRRYPYPYYP